MSTATITALPAGIDIKAKIENDFAQILTPQALALVAKLHRAFEPRRAELLAKRAQRQKELDAGKRPDWRQKLVSSEDLIDAGRSVERVCRNCSLAFYRTLPEETPVGALFACP